MKFQIGDRVSFVDEVGFGYIQKILNDAYVIVDEHGFEWEMKADELILDDLELKKSYKYDDFEIDNKKSLDEANLGRYRDLQEPLHLPKGRKDYLEIDLHIHELVRHISHLSNHEMVSIQIDHFKRFFEMAKENKCHKLIVIHGLGQGALKSEIRNILNASKNCSYRDADYRKYGLGATEINLWYN